MNLDPVDPAWLKADLLRAVDALDAGRPAEAISAVEDHLTKLRELLANLNEIESALTEGLPVKAETPLKAAEDAVLEAVRRLIAEQGVEAVRRYLEGFKLAN